MRRVVITGLGIVSPIGNSPPRWKPASAPGNPGSSSHPTMPNTGFRSQVHGQPKIVLEDHIDKRDLRFMGDGAAYNFIAMEQAVEGFRPDRAEVSNERTGIIVGSGGPSTKSFFKAHNIVRENGAPSGSARSA
jgi:3-oxoacyl-[acyl-carrier-protein] synthase-1